MRTDIIYYALFEYNPAIAIALAGLPLETAKEYQFASVELKQYAHRADGILLPKFPDLPALIVEVQFQRDEQIYDRLVSESAVFRLQKPEYPFLRMVLLLAHRSLDVDPYPWNALVESGAIQVVYLDEITLDEIDEAASLLMRLTVSPHRIHEDTPIVERFRGVIKSITDVRMQDFFSDLFVILYSTKYTFLSKEEVMNMIDMRKMSEGIENTSIIQAIIELKSRDQRRVDIERMLRLGMTQELIISALDVAPELVEEIRQTIGQ
jgi:predicted transposase YdaD